MALNVVGSGRVARLQAALHSATPTICPERALLYTEAFRRWAGPNEHVPLRKAAALAGVLAGKTVRIFPDELLVGNFTSHRVGGLIAPETHGIVSLVELPSFPARKTDPLQIAPEDMRALRRLIPYWATRWLAYQTYRSPLRKARFLFESLRARDWIIFELGGVGHLAPDYARLIRQGTDGIGAEVRQRMAKCEAGSEAHVTYQAVLTVLEALAELGERYAEEAARLAKAEQDSRRREELEQIARICRRVPRYGARTFHEALQALLLAHIAIVNEGLEVSICPGRMDQYLFPYYVEDLESGRTTRERAKELLSCFCIKLCETVPVLGSVANDANGGLPSYQTVVIGGVDRDGNDAVNELSYVLLEVTDELRLREPNFHARLHDGSPEDYVERIYGALANGANSPALYNDDLIVPTLVTYGHSLEDARDYAPIGCVEPTCQGKSFASTDAVVFNTPAVLELALNEGKRFGSRRRVGAKTMPVSRMTAMQDVVDAFRMQLRHRLSKMVADLKAVERANAEHHPTPLTSALIEGCIERGRDVTRGGARYNRSGIQCVGATDVGDSLYAIDQLVFRDRNVSLAELVQALKENLGDEVLRARLKNMLGFGNDDAHADQWTVFVAHEFGEQVEALGENTRGGPYVAGLYSVTSHVFFGRKTGALPNGRRQGEPFVSGIAPANGRDRRGPTAILNSMNRLDYSRFPNGINFNIRFQAGLFRGAEGRNAMRALMDVYFARGGMQAQFNILDADMLRRARRAPEQFPNLLVRVSGYSAYFTDLSEAMQDEIISRTENALGA
jgi:formate C-acetyltransferase